MHTKSSVVKIVIIFCIVLSVVLSTNAAIAGTVEETLKANMKKVYDKALSLAGMSEFNGYCGKCTGRQLQAAGIYNKYVGSDGNGAYAKYTSVKPSSGVSVTAFPGKYQSGTYTITQICNLLNDLNVDGQNTYTVFCFDTGSSSDAGQKYGHVLLVHAVYDGKVYWGESYGANTRVASIASFASTYAESGKKYHFDGAVAFGYNELKEQFDNKIGDFSLVAEIEAVVTTRSDKGIAEYKLQKEPYAAASTGRTVVPGTDLTTTGVYKNKHGNYWLRFTDGTYLCANDVKLKTPITAPETSGLVYPKGNLTFGKSFELKGTITSQSTMPEVWAAVYKLDGDKVDNSFPAVTAYLKNVKTVDIYTSALNKSSLGGISFNKLAKGDYYFTLWAYYYTYQDVEKTSENPLRRKQAVFLVDEPFTVGSSSSSSEEVNDAVDLCTLNAKFTYNKDTNTHKLPYAAATKLGTLKAGQSVTVTKLVQNRYNNIWAQLSDGSYVCFYDKTTGEHHMTFQSTNALKVSDDVKKPTGDIPLATSFGLRGTITADMPIYSVTAKVTNQATEDVAVGPVTATSAKGAFTKSVTMNQALNGVNINDKMSFKKLTTAGYYRYEVIVQLGFIYAFDGEVFQFGTEQVAISSDFTAGNPENEELLPDVPDEPTLTRLPGDANDDAVVDIYDALLILQYDAGWNVSLNTSNADVNADNSVDIHDAVLILQYGAGWNVVLK